MSDQIYKLQPHRTMHLQDFDDYGAAAALWGASDTGFTVSGVFRDIADFAVLVLFQKDDPFGHPLFSYLPDGDLTGLVLDFDVTWQVSTLRGDVMGEIAEIRDAADRRVGTTHCTGRGQCGDIPGGDRKGRKNCGVRITVIFSHS